jgi:hypothetical protein
MSCPFPGLAKYKNLLGEAGTRKGLRQYRILEISILDVSVVLIFAYIFSLLDGYPFWMNAAVLFILGIIVHRSFCVRTTVDKFLFP